jgi:hypothetical protein
MKFKIISSIAIAAVSIAAFALMSTAYGFAESFATASVVLMLPLAFEPLGRSDRPVVDTVGIPRAENARRRPEFRELAGRGSRILAIHRHAA